MEKKILSDYEFFELASTKIHNYSDQQVDNRILSFMTKQYDEGAKELKIYRDAIDYSRDVINELKFAQVEARLLDLEKANRFSWTGFLMSVVLLPGIGTAVTLGASIALSKILRSRLIFGKMTTEFKFFGKLNSKEKKQLKMLGDFEVDGRIAELEMYKDAIVNTESVAGIIATKTPGLLKSATDSYLSGEQSSLPKKEHRTEDITLPDVLLKLRSDVQEQIEDLKSAYENLKMITKEQLLAENSSAFRDELVNIFQSILKHSPAKTVGPQLVREDKVKVLAQQIIISLCNIAKIPIPREILPKTEEQIHIVEVGGNYSRYGRIRTAALEERVKQTPHGQKLLEELSKFVLEEGALRKNELISYAAAYSKKEKRVRNVALVKRYIKLESKQVTQFGPLR